MTGTPPDASGSLDAHVASRAPEWFPDLVAANVRVQRTQSRMLSFSALHHFELRAGARCVRLIAKSRRTDTHGLASLPGWETLVPLPALPERARLEFGALERIHRQFGALRDPRFGSVRPLGLLAAEHTLFLEELDQADLAQWLDTTPGRAPGPVALRAVGHAGAWLRHFHDARPDPATPVFATTRKSFLASVRVRTARLARIEGDASFFETLVARLARLIDTADFDALPEGPAHSDFWPGNLLVDARARVTVIDTLAAWRGAIFYDLAYFLNSIAASNRRAYLQGRWPGARSIAELERRFLEGYFGRNPPPIRLLRAFQIQLLLHNWQRAAMSIDEGPTHARRGREWRLALKRPFFRRLLEHWFEHAEATLPGDRSVRVASR